MDQRPGLSPREQPGSVAVQDRRHDSSGTGASYRLHEHLKKHQRVGQVVATQVRPERFAGLLGQELTGVVGTTASDDRGRLG